MAQRVVFNRPEHTVREAIRNLITNFKKGQPAGRFESNPDAPSYNEDYLGGYTFAIVMLKEFVVPLTEPKYYNDALEDDT